MKDLFIGLIHASSPQAKGRVERANKTLQDRLVKQMRLNNISSIEDANNFLQQGSFILEHNAKYAVAPTTEGNAHRSIDEFNLKTIFCTLETRVVASDFTVVYKRKTLQIERSKALIKPKDKVFIRELLDGTITVHSKNHFIPFKEIPMRKPTPVNYVLWENKIPHNGDQFVSEKTNFSCC